MSPFKKILISLLIFEFTYAPVGNLALAQNTPAQNNNALEPVKQPDAYFEWGGQIQDDGKTLEFFKKGTRIDVQVLSKPKQNSSARSGQSALPDISTSIVPGTNTREIYEAERPFRIRKKLKEMSALGTWAHYASLRHHDPRYSEEAPANMRLNKRSKVTLQDVKNGGQNFSVEQMFFSISSGAFTVLQLMTAYSKNPVAFQQFIDGLTDPFGNFSFYSFMVANGYSSDFIKDRFLKSGPKGKAMIKTYASVINYMGMAAGTIVSHFTGDMLRLMQQCSKSLLTTEKKDVVSNEALAADPCELAWKEWTLEKKFNTYAPSIVSTVTAGMLSAGTTEGFIKAYGMVATSTIATKVSESAAVKTLISFTILGAKIFGPEAKLNFIVRGTQKILNFGIFIGFQQAIESWISSAIGNFTRTYYGFFPGVDSFVGKANALFKLFDEEKSRGWESSGNRISCSGKWVQIPFVGAYCKTNDMLSWLQDFSDTMQGWREFNQVHEIEAHQNWIQKINNLKSVERAAFYFNNEFIKDLQMMNGIPKAQAVFEKTKFLDPSEIPLDENGDISEETTKLMQEQAQIIDAATYSPKILRLYPLFGVKPMEWKTDDIVSYFNYAEAKEVEQMKFIKLTLQDFLIPTLKVVYTPESDKAYFKSLIENLSKHLQNQDKNSMISVGIELNRIRVQLLQGFIKISRPGKDILIAFMDRLGKPAPILAYGLGFAEGFDASKEGSEMTAWQQHLSAAVVDLHFGPYIQSKKSDFLFYKMACGTKLATVNEASFINERWGFADEFSPPRIISPEVQPDFCQKHSLNFKPSVRMYWEPIKDLASKKSYDGITSLVYQNLIPDMAEMIQKDVTEENSRFTLWWNQLVEPTIKKQFEKYRQQYEDIAVDFVKTLYMKDSKLNQGAVKNAVALSTQQEIRLYSLVLSEMLRDLIEAKKLDGKSELFKTVTNLEGWSKSQLKTTSDIFKLQLSPYNTDVKALKANASPRVFGFQVGVEKLVQDYDNILSKIKIENKNGKELVVSTYTEDDLKSFEEQKKALGETLKPLLDQVGSKPELFHAAQIASFCAGKILSLPEQINGFLLQLKVVEYNRDAGPDKVDCSKIKPGAIKPASCK